MITMAKSSSSSSASYFSLLLFLFSLPISIAESEDPSALFCNTQTNITSGSQISSNIARLLPELVRGASQDGFITTSYGKSKDKVYGLAQCRGDVSSQDCSSCIRTAAEQILERCPNQADSRIWYEYCFLRYNTRNFFGEVDTSFGVFYYNVQNVTDPETFNESLGKLTDEIISEADSAPKSKGLGKGKKKLSPFSTLYALVQCTRDLSGLSCAQCLATAVGNFETFCGNKRGCRVLYSSCYVRYELYPFYFPLGTSSPDHDSTVESYRSIKVYKP